MSCRGCGGQALAEPDAGESARRLSKAGVKKDALLKALKEVRGSTRITDPNPEDKYQALKRYTRDLTDLARRGKIDPVIGRDQEIIRTVREEAPEAILRVVSQQRVPGDWIVSVFDGNKVRVARSRDHERALKEIRTALGAIPQLPSKRDYEEIVRRLSTRTVCEKCQNPNTARAVTMAVAATLMWLNLNGFPTLFDEAAARLRTEIDSMPAELDEITRRVLQLEIERTIVGESEGIDTVDALGGLHIAVNTAGGGIAKRTK